MITSGIFWSAVFQGGFQLTLALTGIFMMIQFLRWLDYKIEGSSFNDCYKEASPDARMQYFAYRILAVSILVGLVIS